MDIRCLYMKDYYDAKLDGCYYYHMVNGRPLSAKAHKHDFYEIICVLSGSCYHTINGLEYYCQAVYPWFVPAKHIVSKISQKEL